MGFGFSSMPSAAQRAAQAQAQLPNSMALAQQAASAAGGAPPATPGAPGGSAPGTEQVNIQQPQQIHPQTYDPGGVHMPAQGVGGIPTPTPWNPGGVNLPPSFSGATDAAAGAGAGPAAAAGGNPAWMDLLASVIGL